MSQFEYVAIAVSLILSLGVARILNGISHALNGEHHYWVHTSWVLVSLANFAIYWWSFWAARDVASWHLGSFLAVLAYPALLYIGAALLVPGDSNRVTQWYSHFYSVRRPLFLTYLVATTFFAAGVASGVIETRSPTAIPFGLFWAVIYSVGLVSKDERTHRILAVAAVVCFLAMHARAIFTGLS